MNFLELSKRVRQEVGYSGTGPVAVEGQSGVYQKVVDWVQAAVEAVHLSREQWAFDWARHEAPLVAGQAAYPVLGSWGLHLRALAPDPAFVYRTSEGVGQRYWLCELPWAAFRQLAPVSSTGMPVYCALSPDQQLHLHPAPGPGLTLSLEYYRQPQALEVAQDVPRIPPQHHMAIVWHAVHMAAAHDENLSLLQTSALRRAEAMARLERTELPGMDTWEPLA